MVPASSRGFGKAQGAPAHGPSRDGPPSRAVQPEVVVSGLAEWRAGPRPDVHLSSPRLETTKALGCSFPARRRSLLGSGRRSRGVTKGVWKHLPRRCDPWRGRRAEGQAREASTVGVLLGSAGRRARSSRHGGQVSEGEDRSATGSSEGRGRRKPRDGRRKRGPSVGRRARAWWSGSTRENRDRRGRVVCWVASRIGRRRRG